MTRAPSPDALCRRSDDSGIVPRAGVWEPCVCAAGAVVLEQRAAREAMAAGGRSCCDGARGMNHPREHSALPKAEARP